MIHVVCFLTGATIIAVVAAIVVGLIVGATWLNEKIRERRWQKQRGMSYEQLHKWDSVKDWASKILLGLFLLSFTAYLGWLSLLLGCAIWHHN